MKRRALIIANGRFTDDRIKTLKSPARDAQRLSNLLQRTSVGEYECDQCIDRPFSEVMQYIHGFCDKGAPDDLHLIFISGHGIKDSKGLLYFATRDTDVKRLQSTSVPAKYLIDRIDDSRTGKQIVFIDTCYSGAFQRVAATKSALNDISKDDFPIDDSSGKAVITATTAIQLASETRIGGSIQSLFTREFITGIETGAADPLGSGRITLDGIFTHIRERLRTEAPEQTPTPYYYGIAGDVVIARNPNALVDHLPPDYLIRSKSKFPEVRLDLVDELLQCAKAEPKAVASATKILKTFLKDDSKAVSTRAKAALTALGFGRSVSRQPPDSGVDNQADLNELSVGHSIDQPQIKRSEKERHEAERAEAARLEEERQQAARAEAARRDAERREAKRAEFEKLEEERHEAERAEAAKLEKERQEAERAKAAKLERERQEAERTRAARLEEERQQAARAEAARRDAERREAKLASEKLEKERQEAERAEAARRDAENAEAARREKQRLEARMALRAGKRQEEQRGKTPQPKNRRPEQKQNSASAYGVPASKNRRLTPATDRTTAQRLIKIVLISAATASAIIVVFLATFAYGLPDTSKLYQVQRSPSISFLDRSGGLVAERGDRFAPPVNLDQLPPYVPAAFIASEDRRFYHHFGIDVTALARAALVDLKVRGMAQRGATITEKLARILFFGPTLTFRQKIQQSILAVWLETKFSKKEILALYLNRVYFGEGAYGIEAAAQRYFSKPASQLSLGEVALLVGLSRKPSRVNPISETDRASAQATVVLDEMVKTRAITPAQRDNAFAEPVRVSRTLANQHAQYFVDWVDSEVRAILGRSKDDVLQQDLVVETTIDLPIQTDAEHAVQIIAAADAKAKGVQQAALVAMDGEGRVRAFVGGLDYGDSQLDRAVNIRRQAGSSWKPFVYLTAMENGRTPDTPVVDEPIKIGDWEPQNFTGRYLGPITLQTALVESINTVAARLANEVGTQNVARTARRLGITSPIQTDPSMALGAVEVSPLEMAQAYASFANGGYGVKAYGIERIRTASGRVLYDQGVAKPDRPRVIETEPLAYMNQMMRKALTAGRGAEARIPGYDLAGKTGTTSDYRDAWFVGYTGGFVASVWVGKDDNTPMKAVTGGSYPAMLWQSFMTAALPKLKVSPIPGHAPKLQTASEDIVGNLLAAPSPDRNSTPPARPGTPSKKHQEAEFF